MMSIKPLARNEASSCGRTIFGLCSRASGCLMLWPARAEDAELELPRQQRQQQTQCGQLSMIATHTHGSMNTRAIHTPASS
jgi:hypothetical protein